MGAEESTLSEEVSSGVKTVSGQSGQTGQTKTLERFPRTSFIPGNAYGGGGAFGNVVSGTLEGKFVIVKILHSPVPKKKMTVLQEMCKLEHRNLIRFMGVIDLEPTDCPQLVFKNANKGNLFEWLKNGKGPSDEKTLHKFACDIINGMEYLHSMDFIHGCLAARNILIDEFVQTSTGTTYLNAKISDYGMTRVADGTGPNYYKMGPTTTKTLPLRWMPKEAVLSDNNAGVITRASDVWSFGVVLWEMCTKCDAPYGSTVSNTEVRQNILDGKSPLTFHRPAICPDKVISVMNSIFKVNQNERPTFTDLSKAFNSIQGGKQSQNKSKPVGAGDSTYKGKNSQPQTAQLGRDSRPKPSYQKNERNPEKPDINHPHTGRDNRTKSQNVRNPEKPNPDPNRRGNVGESKSGSGPKGTSNPYPNQKRSESKRHPPSYSEMAPPAYTPLMGPLMGQVMPPGMPYNPQQPIAQGGYYPHPPPMNMGPVPYGASQMPPPPPYAAATAFETAEMQAQRIRELENKISSLEVKQLEDKVHELEKQQRRNQNPKPHTSHNFPQKPKLPHQEGGKSSSGQQGRGKGQQGNQRNAQNQGQQQQGQGFEMPAGWMPIAGAAIAGMAAGVAAAAASASSKSKSDEKGKKK